jgi:predicted RNA-binding protein with PIN domain
MSLHFLLDGYNIIKQTSDLNRGTLEQQREALLNWINVHRPQGSDKNGVTVIFDGKEEFFGSHTTTSPIKVVFSRGQSADDVIKKMAESYSRKNNLVVVSDDKDIKLYVRALGARVLSVKEFAGTSSKKSGAQKKQASASHSKYISLTDQAKINKEFERIWIKPYEL